MEEAKENTDRLIFKEADHRYEGVDTMTATSIVVNESRLNTEIMVYVREHPGVTTDRARQALLAPSYWLGKEGGVSLVPLGAQEAKKKR
jgi:hypothetical protein